MGSLQSSLSDEKKREDLRTRRPRLKVGTLILPREDFTYVGRLDEGLAITCAARSALTFLNGGQSCEELSRNLGTPLAEIAALVMELDNAALIDTEETTIRVHTRFHSPNAHRASHAGDDSNDAAFQQLKVKLAPELNAATWLSNVRDGGVSIINARRNWQINIYGESRIATLLYGIFLSSGITQTRLHPSQESKSIAESDLCAGYLRASDIGLSYKSRTEELARELSLFPITSTGSTNSEDLGKTEGYASDTGKQRISIVVGTPPSDQLQKWMSEGVTHILIDDPDGASVTVGPLIIPGETPCSRCVSIGNEDLNELWRDIAWKKQRTPPTEVPVAVAHHVAGIVALELLQYLDAGSSEMLGTSTRIKFHAPADAEKRLYARHPACGCTW